MRKLLGVLLLAGALMTAFGQTFEARHGSWSLLRDVDLITDENRSGIMGDVTEYPGYSRGAGMVIRCRQGAPYGVEVYFFADQYLGSRASYPVVYRVDGGQPVNASWLKSTTNESVFAPDQAVEGIINDLLDGARLVFRVTSFSGPETYVQPIDGLREALIALGCYTGQL